MHPNAGVTGVSIFSAKGRKSGNGTTYFSSYINIITRKAQLTQRGTRNSGACLKAQSFSRQRAPDDRQLIIYSVLLVLTRGRDLSRSANAVTAENRKFSPPLLI